MASSIPHPASESVCGAFLTLEVFALLFKLTDFNKYNNKVILSRVEQVGG